MNKKIKITGLDCPNCARELEEEIEKIEDVQNVNVDFVKQQVHIEYSKDDTVTKVIDVCNHFEEVKVVNDTKSDVFKICGLDCPNCAQELEEELLKLEGVQDARVDFVNQKVFLEYEQDKNLDAAKDVCNHFEEVKVVDSSSKKLSFKITGLDCANCANELEEEIEKVEGVQSVTVDFVNQKVFIEVEDSIVVEKVKYVCNHFEEVKVIEEKTSSKASHKKEIIAIIVSSILYIAAIVLYKVFNLDYSDWSFTSDVAPFIISFVLFIASYIIVGLPVLISTGKNIAKGKIFDENFLMTIASIGAMAIGEMVEGTAVMLLYQIGELLQSIAVESSRNSISSLMDLKPETAILLKNEQQVVVAPEELKIGDIILIKNGEKVPVDCQIIEGTSSFDTKSLTGEALLKECDKGDNLLSGYINSGAVIKAEVQKTYENSTVAKILDLVENSSAKKAESEKFITKFAKIYTPIVCSIAFIIGLIVPLFISLSNGLWADNYVSWLYRALILLVISCPCALIISVPLTYFGGIGACAKRGVLVKGTTYLDMLAKIEIAAFDKTGTLTEGSFEITNVSGDKEKVLSIASAAEKGSTHPIARVFDNIETKIVAENITEVPGQGLICEINNEKYFVGNYKLLKSNQIKFEEINSLSTLIYVANEKECLGYIEIDDKIKEETIAALESLKNVGVERQVMLTGDNQARAIHVGEKLNLDEVYGELLPDDKLNKANELKEQGKLLYVGDGINDAPVMITSDCSISMGKLGSDAAIEASDVVLISDHLSEVANAIKIAKKTKTIVYENIIFSILCKVTFMVLGILNIIPLWVAVFADVGVMLIAVINSLRVRIFRK